MNETAVTRLCPSFHKCNAHHCPLDPLYGERGPSFPGEEKCRAHKPTRLRVAKEALAAGIPEAKLVKFGGLTSREHAGQERWNAMSPEEQEAMKANLVPFPSRGGSGSTNAPEE